MNTFTIFTGAVRLHVFLNALIKLILENKLKLLNRYKKRKRHEQT